MWVEFGCVAQRRRPLGRANDPQCKPEVGECDWSVCHRNDSVSITVGHKLVRDDRIEHRGHLEQRVVVNNVKADKVVQRHACLVLDGHVRTQPLHNVGLRWVLELDDALGEEGPIKWVPRVIRCDVRGVLGVRRCGRQVHGVPALRQIFLKVKLPTQVDVHLKHPTEEQRRKVGQVWLDLLPRVLEHLLVRCQRRLSQFSDPFSREMLSCAALQRLHGLLHLLAGHTVLLGQCVECDGFPCLATLGFLLLALSLCRRLLTLDTRGARRVGSAALMLVHFCLV
mmetsp:Transcript_10497/g.26970  ORF Transcript_10497/g.26970 Transcript_10497/m.26970 type:complete len:282 (-) Transcript_10497:2599-3444(-)